jgi:hypothetical protein
MHHTVVVAGEHALPLVVPAELRDLGGGRCVMRTGYGGDYSGDEDGLDGQEDPQEDVVRLPGLELTLTL